MNLLKPQQDSEPEEALETAMAMVASALSDPSRVSILCALMDGRAWTATELSTVAEVSASTTSGHLARLLSNGWWCVSRRGATAITAWRARILPGCWKT
jgi:DNA-binding transcriptional ArsR family regulator